ncbi:hypothetical protein EON83_20200 [bacterium]|nr:MAG: hypothetical protein EON83_20200 [bacterium]
MASIQTTSRLELIEGTMREAVADAIETHRRMGRSIVVMENGQIKHIKAKDLKPRPLPNDEME